MAFELTTTARLLSEETNIRQQIILEIDGIPLIFGAVEVSKLWRVGNEITIGQPGLVIGGTIEDPNSRAYISLSGTSNQINQQLEVDKGGVGSIQKFTIALVDKDQELTQLFTPGNVVPDLLSREANVFLNFQGGAHPEDSIRIFNGVVTGQQASPGLWKIVVDHPESLKNSDVYTQIQTNTTSAANDTTTTIPVISTTGFLPSQDASKTYIRVNEELMEVVSFDAISFTVNRGALNTIASSHDSDSEVLSFYEIEGQALDLALKLMLSESQNTFFKTDELVTQFEFINNSLTVNNGILLRSRVQDDLGLTLGDLVTTTGALNAQNNVVDAPILSFQPQPEGMVLILGGVDLTQETESPATASFKSQFNVLPDGAGMSPSQVDVAQHLQLREFFSVSLPDYRVYLKDTINLKEFITNEIYFPQGFYQVPRKGRASVNITQPPLVLDDLVELSTDNLKNVDKSTIKRQTSKNFFNTIVYRFDDDELEERFKAGVVVTSENSINRIGTGTKTLKIESSGLRDSPQTRQFITNQSRRFADRYKFAAESIQVECNYKTGFNIEIADVVLYGGSDIQLPDINNGSRDFEPRLMEVVNKQMDIKTGRIRLELLDTLQGVDDGRFGVVSPNSFIASGSSSSIVFLKNSFSTGEFEFERDKWVNFINQEITIRSQDFTFRETVRLAAFDPASTNGIVVSPSLSSAPLEDYIVDLPEYAQNNSEENRKGKGIHCFSNPEVEVTASVDNFTFGVGAGDIARFFEEAVVRVHDDTFVNNSTPTLNENDARVVSVDTGLNQVTVDRDLGFLPLPGFKVDLIGFDGDEGFPYRYI